MKRVVILATLLIAAGGCRSYPNGADKGPCYADDTCDPGAACVDGTCQRPPEVDCARVAMHLSVIELGNYADRDERDAFVTVVQGRCARADLKKPQGECLMQATSRQQLLHCDPPLVEVEDCDLVVAKWLDVQGHADARVINRLYGSWDDLLRRCRSLALGVEQKRCVSGASDLAALQECGARL